MRGVISGSVFASFLVLAAPTDADEADDNSADGTEESGDAATAPVDAPPPDADSADDDEGMSE